MARFEVLLLASFIANMGVAQAQQPAPPATVPSTGVLQTGNNTWPKSYTDTQVYNCPDVTFTFRRMLDSVHRVVSVAQVVGDRAYPSPELQALLDQLGNWRQTFMEAVDCQNGPDRSSLLVRVVQLPTPSRPQSSVKVVEFLLHPAGGISIR